MVTGAGAVAGAMLLLPIVAEAAGGGEPMVQSVRPCKYLIKDLK